MSVIQDCILEVRLSGSGEIDRLADLVHDFTSVLWKSGQIWSHALISQDETSVYVSVETPAVDSLAPEFDTPWVTAARKQVDAYCASPPCWVARGRNASLRQTTEEWLNGEPLYLYVTALEDVSPLRSAFDGEPVPLYLLPASQELRQDLMFWSSEYRCLDRLWLASGALERESLAQLTDPGSLINMSGQAVARAVEQSLGVPVYFYLFRDGSTHDVSVPELCPSCGARPGPDHTRIAMGARTFGFSCKLCRLVSGLNP